MWVLLFSCGLVSSEQGLPSDHEEDILEFSSSSSEDSMHGSEDDESDKENEETSDLLNLGKLVKKAMQKGRNLWVNSVLFLEHQWLSCTSTEPLFQVMTFVM